MDYEVRLKSQKSTIVVRFDSIVDGHNRENWKVFPYCVKVLNALRKQGAKIVLWTNKRHSCFPFQLLERGGSSFENEIEFLVENGVQLDSVIHYGNDVEYDLLICKKAGFSGDWKDLGIALQALRTKWRVYIAECTDGSLKAGYSNYDVRTVECDLKLGKGPDWLNHHVFEKLVWVSNECSRKRARRLFVKLRKLTQEKRKEFVSKQSGEKKVNPILQLIEDAKQRKASNEATNSKNLASERTTERSGKVRRNRDENSRKRRLRSRRNKKKQSDSLPRGDD